MFRGCNKDHLDDKGGWSCPPLPEQIAELAQGKLVVTSTRISASSSIPCPNGTDRTQADEPASLNATARRLQRLMVGHATDLPLDGHGRVLLPPELREFAKLGRHGMLIGQGNRFELWDEARWSERATPGLRTRTPDRSAFRARVTVAVKGFDRLVGRSPWQAHSWGRGRSASRVDEHTPVLAAEALAGLALEAGGYYVDATFGRGGHTSLLLQAWSRRPVLALDRDPQAIAAGRQRFADEMRLTLVHASFADLGTLVPAHAHDRACRGVLFDLGVSRRSSMIRSAVSASELTARSTCAWTRRAANPFLRGSLVRALTRSAR